MRGDGELPRMNDQTKTCTKCGETKPLSEFYADKRGLLGVRSQCKACMLAYGAARHAENPERHREVSRKSYHMDVDVSRERGREKARRNRPQRREALRAWRAANPEKSKAIDKAWKDANPDKVKAWTKRWRDANPDNVKGFSRRRYEKAVSTPRGRLEHNIRSAVPRGLRKGTKASRHTFDLLGYTVDDLREHLATLLLPGMSWANYGEWHIDHIRPLASFSYETPDDPEFKEAWALSNLQPLWGLDNLSKGAKWQPPQEAVNDNASSDANVGRG